MTTEVKIAVDQWFDQNDPESTKFENVDNTRYAFEDVPEQVEQYYDIAQSGCCGFLDTKITLPGGRILMFGFNYGH